MDNDNLNAAPEAEENISAAVEQKEEEAENTEASIKEKISEAVQDGKAATEKMAEAAGQTAEKVAAEVSEAAEMFEEWCSQHPLTSIAK